MKISRINVNEDNGLWRVEVWDIYGRLVFTSASDSASWALNSAGGYIMRLEAEEAREENMAELDDADIGGEG